MTGTFLNELNSIVWGNFSWHGVENIAINAGTLSELVSYSCVGGLDGWDDKGVGNFGGFPGFVEAGQSDDNGDADVLQNYVLTDGDYHLTNESFCVNAGRVDGEYVGAMDIDGAPRVLRGRVDIGADEVPYVGDFEADDDVDLLDFGVFALNWLKSDCSERARCDGADLTNDGNVDVDDLVEYAENWLAGF